jgi:hypothetical protein
VTAGAAANGGPAPFDLDAAIAEAEGDPFAFTWRGTRYEIPPVASWEIKAQRQLSEAADSGDEDAMNAALGKLIGPVLEELIEAGMTNGGLTELIAQATRASGITEGGPGGGKGNQRSSPHARRALTRT